MFAIYNKGSVTFRSTSGNLYTLEKVDQASPSRHKPDDDIYYSFDQFLKKKTSPKTQKAAIDKYNKVSTLDTHDIVYYVKDIMSHDIICIDSQATLQEAYDLLKKEQISQIPVVTYGNHLISMVSKKNILNFILEDIKETENILQQQLKELVFPELITSDPNSDIRQVAKVMLNYQIDAMPIVDQKGVILGMLSKTDLIKAISNMPDLQLWA